MNLLNFIPSVVDRVLDFIPNPEERRKAEEKIKSTLTDQIHEIALAQIEVNKTEAAHKSIFVAGWRPFVGWICACGVAWAFVLQPIANWIAAVIFAYNQHFPEVDIANLIVLLTGLLGMGGLRTYEKSMGVSREK